MGDRALEPTESETFLITGCQRSGTTLLGMALEAHPSVEIVEENNQRFHKRGAVDRELDLEAVVSYTQGGGKVVGFKVPRDSHRLKQIVGALPSVLVVWVDREIRQTVSSMLSLPINGETWAAVAARQEIAKYLSTAHDESARRLFEDTLAMSDAASRSAALASLCWLVKRQQRDRAIRLFGPNLCCVNYEALTTDPAAALRGILEFLDLAWNPSVLDHPASIAPRARPGKADSSRPIDTNSYAKWKTQLTPRDLEVIENTQREYDAAEMSA